MTKIGRRIVIGLAGLAAAAGVAAAAGFLFHVTSGSVPVAVTSTTAPASEAPVAVIAASQASETGPDLQRATWDALHRFPESASANDETCLTCHQEILQDRPRMESPAGLRSADALAWYQTLDTYSGEQESFHWRHLRSPLAQQVMNLGCNFCHQANDPREESPHAMRAAAAAAPAPFQPLFTLRRHVNPGETCLRCHGSFPAEVMGLTESWHETREGLEDEETPNGCLTCHADTFRTERHRVTYLSAEAIEKAAQTGSDVCFGCHGGRSWYRVSYPYPRTPWPDMPEETPDWAIDRPRHSDPRFALPPR